MGKRVLGILCTAFLCATTQGLWGEAAELKTISPQSYKQLTRVSQVRARDIFKECKENLSQEHQYEQDEPFFTLPVCDVYEQEVLGQTFYRLFFSYGGLSHIVKKNTYIIEENEYVPEEVAALKANGNTLYQYLFMVHSGKLIFLGRADFSQWEESNSAGLSVLYADFLLVPRQDSAFPVGCLKLEARVGVEQGLTRRELFKLKIKTVRVQPTAMQYAQYALLGNERLAVCTIQASDFLFDKSAPLRYSLLSAFDGETATCYKENSEENTILLTFDFLGPAYATISPVRVTQAAIINGNAADKNTYAHTNRIAAFAVSASFADDPLQTCSVTLKDYTQDVQTMYLPFSSETERVTFVTANIFKGIPFDDTCFSEFDIKLGNRGWLFGRQER